MPRSLMAMCATALAIGAGGVFSGVLPLPPGVPASLVVAGDPAGRTPVAHRTVPASVGGHTTGPGSGTGGAGAGPTSAPAPRPTVSAGPSHSASASASPSAKPTASTPPPSASPSASASSSPGTGVTDAEDQVLALVNTQRAQNGCGALTHSQPLTALAQNFSAEMATRHFFDHTDPDGKSPWDRAKVLGITDLGGENIAMGQQTAQDVMTAWMNSPGHRANILNCSYHSLGVGVYYGSGGGPWWTQDFGF